MKRWILSASWVVCACASLEAQDAAAALQQGIAAYQAQQYDTAIVRYQAALDSQGRGSTTVWNNLGLAYLRKQELGEAIWCFERALHLNAYDGDAAYHLAAAKSQIEEPVQEIKPLWLLRLWDGLRDALSARVWLGLSMVLLLVWSALLFLPIGHWWRGPWGLSVGLIGMVAVWVLSYQKDQLERDSRKAVVVAQYSTVRKGPGLSFGESAVIYEGTSMELLDQAEGWYCVRLGDGLVGWLPMEGVRKV